ncbi:MAG: L,D-transpeptidase family protein [Pseudomonadota bacterium]
MKKSMCFNIFGRVLFYTAFCFFILIATGWASTQKRPEAIILLPENENAIIVEKKSQTLFLYSAKKNTISMEFQVACSTGEASGVKQISGDKKTPEGIYFLIDEYEDRYLTPVYGKKAFPTDYPNLVDKRAGKNGSAIWIHGTDKELKPMDSNGCVALENDSILRLSDLITLDSTPVIMVEENRMVTSDGLNQQEQEIQSMVDQWTNALKSGTYHIYLSFYSASYLPDILWWEEWAGIRKKVQEVDFDFNLITEREGIYQHNGVFVVLFDSFFTLNNEKIYLGKRKLFLENENGQYKIIGDTFQTRPKIFEKTKNPLVAAAKLRVKPEIKKWTILETVNQWLAAWTAKEMDKYAAFYAENFYSDGLSKSRWVKRKRILANMYDYINIVGTDFKVKINDKTCEVVFFQDYESSGLTTQGTKTLKLVDEGGLWKIYQESWKEK